MWAPQAVEKYRRAPEYQQIVRLPVHSSLVVNLGRKLKEAIPESLAVLHEVIELLSLLDGQSLAVDGLTLVCVVLTTTRVPRLSHFILFILVYRVLLNFPASGRGRSCRAA
jgi:hypothetical protein